MQRRRQFHSWKCSALLQSPRALGWLPIACRVVLTPHYCCDLPVISQILPPITPSLSLSLSSPSQLSWTPIPPSGHMYTLLLTVKIFQSIIILSRNKLHWWFFTNSSAWIENTKVALHWLMENQKFKTHALNTWISQHHLMGCDWIYLWRGPKLLSPTGTWQSPSGLHCRPSVAESFRRSQECWSLLPADSVTRGRHCHHLRQLHTSVEERGCVLAVSLPVAISHINANSYTAQI